MHVLLMHFIPMENKLSWIPHLELYQLNMLVNIFYSFKFFYYLVSLLFCSRIWKAVIKVRRLLTTSVNTISGSLVSVVTHMR